VTREGWPLSPEPLPPVRRGTLDRGRERQQARADADRRGLADHERVAAVRNAYGAGLARVEGAGG
jgi:hypothetical protein